jgi:hypothetical protein
MKGQMMNQLLSLSLAVALASPVAAALADQQTVPVKAAAQEMSDAQMDRVAAGIANFNNLVALDVSNVLNNNDVQVVVPVNAAVAVGAVGILSRQTGILTDASAPGRLIQLP